MIKKTMKIKNSIRSITLLTFSFLLIQYLNISETFARAGGGESFGDGGFDVGGGSGVDFGSGSGVNSGSFIPVNSSGGGSGIFITVLIIIIIIVLLSSRRRRRNGSLTDSSVNPSNSPIHSSQSDSEVESTLNELKKVDPKFDTQKFKTHTKKVFMAVQEGWTDRDQKVCRPFMAEDVYQSHQMQIDNMKKAKIINVLENIVVGSTSIVRVDIDEEYHKIAVKMRASMKDYKVNEDNPEKIIEGDKNQSPPFTEYWIFIRKSNLKTKVKEGIFDRKCPNCGAPIEVSVSGVCKYCDANVVNGDYDWVLSEIVQRSEWREI